MDSLELTQLLNEARTAEFGEDQTSELFPSKFFRHDIVVTAVDGQQTPRSPRYCATNVGAAFVSNVMTAELNFPCSLVLNEAMGWADVSIGGFSDSEPVPFCVFMRSGDESGGPFTGPKVNGALLLDYYNHGFPPARARNSCELEIRDAFAAAGMMEALSDDDRQAIMRKP